MLICRRCCQFRGLVFNKHIMAGIVTTDSTIRNEPSTTSRWYTSGAKVMVVGLGNRDLPKTRHSVGMQAVDKLAEWLDVSWERDRKLQAFIAETHVENSLHMILLKPTVPMNLNGKPVAKAAKLHGLDPSGIYLIHDELDKEVGKFGMKEGGSARGHNGVRSTVECLRTEAIPRLRIGVDRPADRLQVADYLLTRFSSEERAIISRTIPLALRLMLKHIQHSWQLEIDLPRIILKKTVSPGAGE